MLNTGIFGGDDLAKKLGSLAGDVRKEVKDSLVRLSLKLVAKIKAEKLSGRPLKVRTGTLRRSISYRLSDTGTSMTSYIGTNVDYAAAHEFGFNGTVTVREHVRQVKQAFGRQLKSPTTATIRAHQRKMNLPERSFIRSALSEMAPEISETIADAIARGIRK